jgi:hypothetical protein
MLMGEANAGDNVGGSGAPHNECGIPIDDSIENNSGSVVALFAKGERLTAKRSSECYGAETESIWLSPDRCFF